MFNPFRREDPQLRAAIAAIYEEMKPLNADDEEYQKMVDRLKDLNDLKNKGLDPNVVATVGGNVVIAAAILAFEKNHVITTKLASFLTKK